MDKDICIFFTITRTVMVWINFFSAVGQKWVVYSKEVVPVWKLRIEWENSFEEMCTGFGFYSEDSDLRHFFPFENGELIVKEKRVRFCPDETKSQVGRRCLKLKCCPMWQRLESPHGILCRFFGEFDVHNIFCNNFLKFFWLFSAKIFFNIN